MMKILFYGCGQMGGAILEGLLSSKTYTPSDIGVFEKDQNRLNELVARGMKSFDPESQTLNENAILILSVKPQIFERIAGDIKKVIKSDTLIISIMAGVSVAKMNTLLGSDGIKVRTMPNLPLAYGEGATSVVGDGVDSKQMDRVRTVFNSVGIVVEVREDQVDAATGVAGSGPAWVFEFVESWIRGGVFEGLTRAESTALAIQTLKGSLKMLEVSGESPANLTAKVCSPGGTTINGVAKLQEKGFHDAVLSAVSAAANRSRELR